MTPSAPPHGSITELVHIWKNVTYTRLPEASVSAALAFDLVDNVKTLGAATHRLTTRQCTPRIAFVSSPLTRPPPSEIVVGTNAWSGDTTKDTCDDSGDQCFIKKGCGVAAPIPTTTRPWHACDQFLPVRNPWLCACVRACVRMCVWHYSCVRVHR